MLLEALIFATRRCTIHCLLAMTSFAPAAVHASAAMLPDRVDQILANWASKKIGIVQAADLLETALRDAGLLYDMDIHCRQV